MRTFEQNIIRNERKNIKNIPKNLINHTKNNKKGDKTCLLPI